MVNSNISASVDMVSRCNNTYLGILGSNHNTCSSLPIRAVKAISGDPTRSIGKVGPHCSYRPFFRSSFVSQPRFNVFISHSRRVRADIKDGNGGGGGGGGNGGGGPGWKDPYMDDDDDNSRDGQVPSFLIILIKSIAISALVTPLYILLTKWLREILSRDSG